MDAAKQAYTAVRAALDAGQATVEDVHAWSVRWLDAELAASARKRDKQRAFTAHQARMSALHQAVESKVNQGLIASTGALKTRYFKLEADAWRAARAR